MKHPDPYFNQAHSEPQSSNGLDCSEAVSGKSRIKNGTKSAIRQITLLGLLGCASPLVLAASFDLADGVSLEWDTIARYSAAWRVEDQDKTLLANPNGDDGNRNFKKGLIQNRFDLISEADLNFGDFGAFVRGRTYYDDQYQQSNDHNSPDTANSTSVAHNRFTKDSKELSGDKAELLDAFVYGSFDISDRVLSLRAGRQVVNWGESLFIQGGISSAMSPLDATKANLPGVELKEIFLPVGQIFGQIDLTENISVSGYYQYEWDKTRLDAAGSYFSTDDFIDDGGESLILAPGLSAARGKDKDASDSGQYGIAVHYLAEELNATEFGFYYINYHDKLPQVIGGDFINPAPGVFLPTSYHLEYAEDIKLYGLSISTVVGDTNVGAEISYRKDQPVMVGELVAPERVDAVQAQASVIHIFGDNPLMDNLTMTAEVAYNRVSDPKGELVNDQDAWGYTVSFESEFNGVAPGVDLTVPVNLSQGVDGKSSLPGTFSEGASSLGVSAQFTYLNNFQTEIGYTAFFGDVEDNALTDRDFVSLNVKYSF